MKKIVSLCAAVFFLAQAGFAQSTGKPPKVLLLIAEQAITQPPHGWWAGEADLSITEQELANVLITNGFIVLAPQDLEETIKLRPAFRKVSIAEQDSVALGRLAKADYIILGKAVGSKGGKVPESTMCSFFANTTAKIVRVKDKKVIAYLDASGSSVHLEELTGAREALKKAAQELSTKILQVLSKGGS